MARNEEKANAMLNRWTSMKMDMSKVFQGRRPADPNECTTLADAERFRRQVIRIISRKVSEIQNASLGEHVIRDLNDTINKHIVEKSKWEKRILELGGTRYTAGKFEDGYEADGVTLQHGKGYKYFGAAKNLPGVRELFEKQEPPKQKRSRKDMYKGIEPDYYGHVDDDDSDLVREEAAMEAKRIQEAIADWERKEAEKLQAQT
ncbi:pre-mRNA-splicing factor ISY1 [Achlya hypogyna]|uniref:Pre-mRNA-splicing factor ISY1 n=1 Tax=Achlya hypogyna TaxID=1202772 RepID=A0A1V9ZL29_ACHHY|nr:pre-mRNA-splicing factor ISY1 [Achlya hypogyna]